MPFVCFRVFEMMSPPGGKAGTALAGVPLHLSRFDPEALSRFDEFRAMPGVYLGIVVVLTDWPELAVKALRFFTVSPFFTEKLIKALLNTAAAYMREGYARGVQRVFQTYPMNEIGDGCRVRCKSGD